MATSIKTPTPTTPCTCRQPPPQQHEGELSKPKKEYLKSWTDERCQHMWDTLTKGAKVHKLTQCMKNANGAKNPEGLCKALSIRVGYKPEHGAAMVKEAFNPAVFTPAVLKAMEEALKQEQQQPPAPAGKSKAQKPGKEKKFTKWLLKIMNFPESEIARITATAERVTPTMRTSTTDTKPAESSKTVKHPPEELAPSWVENTPATRATEKGPKAKPVEDPKAVKPKDLEKAKEPMPVKANSMQKVATIRVSNAETLRRIERTGRFTYKGYLYVRVGSEDSKPAENPKKVPYPPEDASPSWVENDYHSRKTEKGPTEKGYTNDPEEAAPKTVEESKTPMEFKARLRQRMRRALREGGDRPFDRGQRRHLADQPKSFEFTVSSAEGEDLLEDDFDEFFADFLGQLGGRTTTIFENFTDDDRMPLSMKARVEWTSSVTKNAVVTLFKGVIPDYPDLHFSYR